jgi:proteasome accessory factor PafA2
VAIPKVCGIETEYGVTLRGAADPNPVLASSMLINGYVEHHKVGWDFEDESPGRDARGFAREGAMPPEIETHLVNTVLTNGARYYVDHAHPEYSTPECSDALELVCADKAGERILARSMLAARRLSEPGQEIVVYKNNSDGKGNSYGTHENYLVDRATPFADIVRDLTPFFVSRQVFTGAGKVGFEGNWDDRSASGYQLTARADFFETEVGLETTLKRPIINTRDEPHADPEKYRRLHVIVGDANRCEVAQFLKVGTTAIVLKMIEDGFVPDLSLVSPVAALHDVSRDLDLALALELVDGRRLTALQLQLEYLELARKYIDREDDTPENREVLDRWEAVLTALADDPMSLSAQLDWVAKLRVLEGYRERDGLGWNDAKLRAVDLQYHDVRPGRGLYDRLAATGKVERLTTDDEIERAVMEPPEGTRAYFRGRCISRYPEAIAAASWDSVIMDAGRDSLQRVPMREPLKGTRAHVEELLEASPTAGDLIDRLQG